VLHTGTLSGEASSKEVAEANSPVQCVQQLAAYGSSEDSTGTARLIAQRLLHMQAIVASNM